MVAHCLRLRCISRDSPISDPPDKANSKTARPLCLDIRESQRAGELSVGSLTTCVSSSGFVKERLSAARYLYQQPSLLSFQGDPPTLPWVLLCIHRRLDWCFLVAVQIFDFEERPNSTFGYGIGGLLRI